MTEDKPILIINAIVNKENIAELQDYLSAIRPIFKQNGGIPITRYKATEQITGDLGPELISIFQFANPELIKTMINSEAFKGLADLRARVFSKLNITIAGEM